MDPPPPLASVAWTLVVPWTRCARLDLLSGAGAELWSSPAEMGMAIPLPQSQEGTGGRELL